MVVIVHRLGHNRTAVGNGELDNILLSSSPWPVIGELGRIRASRESPLKPHPEQVRRSSSSEAQ